MIKKLWVKFDGMEVGCICEPHRRKCTDKQCKEYVVKFTEIDRTQEPVKVNVDALNRSVKKFETEINKTTRKLKNIKLR